MTTGGTTTTSAGGSPILSAPTTHRRRVADLLSDAEKADPSPSDHHAAGDVSGPGHHSLIRYFLLRKGIPENWILGIEDFGNSFKFGKNLGRKVFGLLMVMLVLSVFAKFTLMAGNHMDLMNTKSSNKRENNGVLILQSFKDDRSKAQRVLSDIEGSSSAALPKRLLERVPVSLKIFSFNVFFFCFVA